MITVIRACFHEKGYEKPVYYSFIRKASCDSITTRGGVGYLAWLESFHLLKRGRCCHEPYNTHGVAVNSISFGLAPRTCNASHPHAGPQHVWRA